MTTFAEAFRRQAAAELTRQPDILNPSGSNN